MTRSIMVFGASGFIGSHVIRKLKEKKAFVIGVDIEEPAEEPHIFIRVDATDLEKIMDVMYNYSPDTVINLIGLPHVPTCQKNPHFSYKINVYTAHNILEASRAMGVKRYVFSSSAVVYGSKIYTDTNQGISEKAKTSPDNIYGWHKLSAENEARAYSEAFGMTSIILRLFNIYGGNPFKGKDVASIFLRKIINNETVKIIGPNKIRDFMYIEDAAEGIAIASLLESIDGIEIINLGSGKPYRIIELFRIITETLNAKPKYDIANEEDTTGYFADISKMREVLKLEPVDLKDGIMLWLKNYIK